MSQRFCAAGRILLLFDYDGTLTPIVSHPDLALLSREVRQVLEDLSSSGKYVVGVISGRSLADVREKVNLPGIVYAGNHGLEIEGPEVHFLHPAASEMKPVLAQLYRDLCVQVGGYTGVIVEDKGLTLSVHYRMTPDQLVGPVESTFDQVVANFRDLAQVRVTYGKKVLEVRPNVEWNKGKAIARLKEAYPPASLVTFFGDDVTDEDGFVVVQDAGGVAVFVGPEGQPTKAAYRVDSAEQVADVLRLLAQL